MKIRLAVFDFDGVIVDSTRMKHEAYLSLARNISPKLVEPLNAALNSVLRGAERRRIAKWTKENLHADLDEQKFLTDYKNLVDEGSKTLALVPGISEFLLELSKNKVLVAILSAAPKEEIVRDLSAHRIDPKLFYKILGSEDGTKLKVLANLLAETKVLPDECAFYGDMPSDYEAAQANQTEFIRIKSFGGAMCDWSQSKPHTIVENYFSLTKQIQETGA